MYYVPSLIHIICVKGFKKKLLGEIDTFKPPRKKSKGYEKYILMIKRRGKNCIIVWVRMVIKNDRYNVLTLVHYVKLKNFI